MGLENNLMATITVTIIPGESHPCMLKLVVKVIGITGNLCSFKGYIHKILIKYKSKKKNSTEGETR